MVLVQPGALGAVSAYRHLTAAGHGALRRRFARGGCPESESKPTKTFGSLATGAPGYPAVPAPNTRSDSPSLTPQAAAPRLVATEWSPNYVMVTNGSML
jgi:hypothetical protein